MATRKRDLPDTRVQGPRSTGGRGEGKAPSGGLPRLLTVPEVAEVLRVTPEYVTRRLVFERRIRFMKVGRRTLFDAVDIENFLRERTITPAQ